jgi:hypothetical protein
LAHGATLAMPTAPWLAIPRPICRSTPRGTPLEAA